MKVKSRQVMFIPTGLVLIALLSWGISGLPGFGNYPGPYGDRINSGVVAECNVTNAPAAVNFDYRALDTLGEEYILFASVAGVALLLRRKWEEVIGDAPVKPAPGRRMAGPSSAVQWLGLWMTGIIMVFGMYVVLHGQLTPGGGFHGGVIIASASLLVYLTFGAEPFHRLNPQEPIDMTEALGAGSYVLVGLGTVAAGGAFLQNLIPLGRMGELTSGGTIPLLNFAVGVAVATGFTLLFTEFIKETRIPKKEEEEQ